MGTQIIDRPYYTEKLYPYINQSIIKILTGQRRVGKSFILRQLIEHIRQTEANANIIYVNKELKKHSAIVTDDDLYNYIVSQRTVVF
jgi:predicted AAA+ superfamily ATPase